MKRLDLPTIRAAVARAVLSDVDLASTEVGVTPVVLKGAALAFLEYEDPRERPFGDVDIYLPPRDGVRLARRLMDMGYEEVALPAWRPHVHYTLRGPMVVEIHFALDTVLALPSGPVPFLDPGPYPGYVSLTVPSPASHAAYVVLHAYTHGFSHRHWRRDIEVILANHPEAATFWDLLPAPVSIPGRLLYGIDVPPRLGRLVKGVTMAVQSPSVLFDRIVRRALFGREPFGDPARRNG